MNNFVEICIYANASLAVIIYQPCGLYIVVLVLTVFSFSILRCASRLRLRLKSELLLLSGSELF